MERTKRTRLDRTISKLVRTACNCQGTNYPIEDKDGFAEPKLEGESYYWTTLSGKTIVYHPNAYGWPTRYHASTLHITVGRGWICQKLAEHWEEQRERKKKLRELRQHWRKLIGKKHPTTIRSAAEERDVVRRILDRVVRLP